MPLIISSADLRNQYSEVSRKCKETGEPIFVTKNGRGDMVVLSMESYDKIMGIGEARGKVLKGMEEANRGEVFEEDDVLLSARAQIK